MESHETILWIEMLIILYVLLVLSMSAVVLGWNMLKTVLTLLRWVLLWVTRAKDLVELAKRFDRWTVETRERQIARGSPPTLGAVLKVLCWRVWRRCGRSTLSLRSE